MNFFASDESDELSTAMSWNDEIPAGRMLGAYSSGLPGPLILVIAGTQADDANAAQPVRSFLDSLQRESLRIRGSFVALHGNSRDSADLRELISLVQHLRSQYTDICVADFHTTAVPSIPYLAVQAHAPSLQLASHFPLHTVTGLQQSLPDSFAEYCNEMGCRGFTFEAGHHRSAAAFSNQVALLWLLLVFASAAARRDVRNFTRYERMLALDSPPVRRHFRLASHYCSKPGDGFVLQPGVCNFDKVRKGSWVGTDRNGAVLTAADGFLLLPQHHQGLASGPGFFLLEEAGLSANDEDAELAANDASGNGKG